MKAVTKFEAKDGKLFDSEFEAETHESMLDLERWYENGNELFAVTGKVGLSELVGWLKENHENANAIMANIHRELYGELGQ